MFGLREFIDSLGLFQKIALVFVDSLCFYYFFSWIIKLLFNIPITPFLESIVFYIYFAVMLSYVFRIKFLKFW